MFNNFPLMIWRVGAIALVVVTLAIARGIYLRRPADGGASGAIAQVVQIIAVLAAVAYVIFLNRGRLAM